MNRIFSKLYLPVFFAITSCYGMNSRSIIDIDTCMHSAIETIEPLEVQDLLAKHSKNISDSMINNWRESAKKQVIVGGFTTYALLSGIAAATMLNNQINHNSFMRYPDNVTYKNNLITLQTLAENLQLKAQNQIMIYKMLREFKSKNTTDSQ